jgi:hypothetical protein
VFLSFHLTVSSSTVKIERVWIFTYENGRLVFSNIDEGTNSLEYIDMMKQVPKIEDALELYDAANSTKL